MNGKTGSGGTVFAGTLSNGWLPERDLNYRVLERKLKGKEEEEEGGENRA